MKSLAPWLRKASLLLLLVVASIASGCVYLRLLQFKSQLANFEKNFSADLSEGFRVSCKNPVLLGDDLRWLGAEPETIRRTGNAEHWNIRWVKDRLPDTAEQGVFDVELQADLFERKLQSISVPERYFSFVPKELFLNALRSAGHAKIDRRGRQAVMDTGGDGSDVPPLPLDLSSIEKMLGIPTERTAEPGAIRYRYIFRPQTPSGPGRPIEVTFFFGAKAGHLKRVVSKLPKGTVTFQFSTPAEPAQ